MTRNYLLALAATLLVTLGAPAAAQGAKMTMRPASKLTLAGGSNVHDWACASSSLDARITLDSAYDTHALNAIAKPIIAVVVSIPVKSLKCGHGKMDDNMYKALQADKYPDIKYVLDTYEVDKSKSTVQSFAALTTGDLTVAGKTVKVQFPITAERKDGGAMKGAGTARLKMTDFGIKPPVALLGTLRTKDEISITFDVLLDRAAVVALTQR